MRRALALLVIGLAAGGCSGGGSDEASRAPERRTTPPPQRPTEPPPQRSTEARPEPQRCLTGSSRSFAGAGVAAVVRRAVAARGAPFGKVVARFGRRNVNGVATTFRVLEARLGRDCRPEWYRVQLPIRPNGAEGWVRARDVRRYRVAFRILVDLSDRTVTVYRGDEVVAATRAAIGSPATPTPTGSYYVNQRLLAANPAGPWGPGGIGISAFSPVLTGWAQGGPIAIHGTNRPESIGQAVSNGCLRIDNALLSRLIHLVPDGTPVRIRA